MNQGEFVERLLKYESKEDLEKTLCKILNVLFSSRPGDNDFVNGANEEKDFIIWFCDLEKYRYNEQM